MTATTNQPVPWYRVSTVWLVLAVLAAAVIMGFTFLYYSIVSFDGMVVDDYYQVGKKIDRVLDRDKAALKHGLVAKVMVNGPSITVFLKHKADYTPPPTLEVNFYYSTRAGQDKSLFVEQQQPGIYQGDIPELEIGKWYVQIEAADWRLFGSLRAPKQQQVIIEPTISH